MGIVLNEKQLAMVMVSTMWSPIDSEVSGPDCMGITDVDAETGREIGETILGASVQASVVAGVRLALINGTLECNFKL